MSTDFLASTPLTAIPFHAVTEAAALAAAPWSGLQDKNAADAAAVEAMRSRLSALAIDGRVVIGEGEKDQAPMLFCGERVGTGSGPAIDLAVDPVDGTTLLSEGRDGAVAVLAATERSAMHDASAAFYMSKIAVGPQARDAIDITATPEDNVHAVAAAKGVSVDQICVMVLDRPRHNALATRLRATGATVVMFPDGDVMAAVQTALPGSPVDLMMGIGGTPEGTIAAVALRCLGGELQARIHPLSDSERVRAIESGAELTRVYDCEDLAGHGDAAFYATGITQGTIVDGVLHHGTATTCHTLRLTTASRSPEWITGTY